MQIKLNKKIIPITAIVIICISLIVPLFNVYGSTIHGTHVSFDTNILKEQNKVETFLVNDRLQYDFQNAYVKINPYGNAPLSAMIYFTTSEAIKAKVTVKGKTENTSISNSFAKTKEHCIPVIGLYPDRVNIVTITLENGQSRIFRLKPDPLYYDVPTPDMQRETELEKNQLYFTAAKGKEYSYAFDEAGDVRWFMYSQTPITMQMLENGHILVPSTSRIANKTISTSYYEMDLLGKIYKEYIIPGGIFSSIKEIDETNFLLITNDEVSDSAAIGNSLINYNSNNGKYKTIATVSSLNEESNLSLQEISSFYYDNDTKKIILFDAKTSTLLCISQEGKIDWNKKVNEGEMTKYSSISLEKNQLVTFEKSEREVHIGFYNINIANGNLTEDLLKMTSELFDDSVEYLYHTDTNSLCVNESNKTTLVLNISNNLNDIVTFKAQMNYVEKLNVTIKGTPKFQEAKIIGQLPKTKIKKTTVSIDKAISPDRNYNMHHIAIKKEKNRLAITGFYHKDDVINIVLKAKNESKQYTVNLAEETKMIKEPFLRGSDSKSEKVTYSINDTGLNGKYNIYISINGIVYDLNQFIYFE